MIADAWCRWVFSNETPSSERGSHAIYTPGSTAQQLHGATWNISYGDSSSASGVVYLDTVSVGDTVITGQAVEAATEVSQQFVTNNGDGLLGLGFPSINTVKPTPQATFVTNAISQGLSSPLFTANLNHNQSGSYNFGFIDDSEYNGTITYTAVDSSQGYWGFDPTIEGTAQNGSIADTGTTLLFVDESIVTAYYNQVPGATFSAPDQGYIFDCTSTLPDVSVAIEGATFTIPGNIINFAPAQNPASCFGGMQANTDIGFSIFGDIFLKSVFVVFEQDPTSKPRLGFATKTITS